MKRTIAIIAATATIGLATHAEARLSPQEMAALEDAAKHCGRMEGGIEKHGYDIGSSVEIDFLNIAEDNGATQGQLMLLRQIWRNGEQYGRNTTWENPPTQEQIQTMKDTCSDF